MESVVVNIETLRKSYGDYIVVKDVSLNIREGEIFGILGPNGAGETSLLECIEGLRIYD